APPGHGVSICVSLLRPKSRGSLAVTSANPDDAISFDGGALEHHEDLDVLVRGVEVARQLIKAPSFAELVSEEIYSDTQGANDAWKPEFFVRKYVRPISHVSGTCRMGSDSGAVVDPQLRINGLSGLRVADASIIPKLISGNTNALSIVIGERCADFAL